MATGLLRPKSVEHATRLSTAIQGPAQIGRYEILGLLGEGGMGRVYRARDPQFARVVAVKVLPQAFAADEDRLRRFEQEFRWFTRTGTALEAVGPRRQPSTVTTVRSSCSVCR